MDLGSPSPRSAQYGLTNLMTAPTLKMTARCTPLPTYFCLCGSKWSFVSNLPSILQQNPRAIPVPGGYRDIVRANRAQGINTS